ncbi:MAG: hypothetical protein ACKO13_01365 [Cytophagales bacterium]
MEESSVNLEEAIELFLLLPVHVAYALWLFQLSRHWILYINFDGYYDIIDDKISFKKISERLYEKGK